MVGSPAIPSALLNVPKAMTEPVEKSRSGRVDSNLLVDMVCFQPAKDFEHGIGKMLTLVLFGLICSETRIQKQEQDSRITNHMVFPNNEI